jgi:NagD protein
LLLFFINTPLQKAKMNKGYLIDMDGVLYKGDAMIPGADEFIKTLNKFSIPYLFLTNNSRPTQRDIALKLKKRLGVKVKEEHIFTSAMATAYFLSGQKPNGSAFILGEGGLSKSIYDIGYAINEYDPDYVVIGESRTLTLEMIEKAIDMIIGGAKLIATNMDPAPKEVGWPKPGTGAVVAMLEEATGIKAFCVGKPSPILMRAARKNLHLATDETVIIGDTMETDILGGVNMGFETILTLSGVTLKEDLSKYAYTPHRVINSVAELIPELKEVRNDIAV